MTTTLRFLAILALGVWIGGGIFVMFFAAPGAFRLLPTRDLAGSFVGFALARLHLLALVAALLFLVCYTWMLQDVQALIRPAAFLVFAMVILTALSQYGVTPRLQSLRQEMIAEHGSIQSAPSDSPARASFARLHGVSASLELCVLVLGLAALWFTVREFGAGPAGAA